MLASDGKHSVMPYLAAALLQSINAYLNRALRGVVERCRYVFLWVGVSAHYRQGAFY